MQVTKASKSDIPAVIELLKIILDEMELPFYLNNDQREVTKLFTHVLSSTTYSKSADIIVAKVDNQVAGLAFGYPGVNETLLDEEFQQHFDQVNIPAQAVYEDPEADDDEWYLDSLVVNPAFQNKGIGTTLLNALPKYARNRKLGKIGLLVDDLNPNAERLYRRLGFKDSHQQVVSNHNYKHLKLDVK